MSLGPQPLDPNSSDGRLIDDGANRSGQIRAIGTVTSSGESKGCDLGKAPPVPCTVQGSFQEERDVTIQVDLPKAGGPARVEWFFNRDPAVAIPPEGTCITSPFHGHTDDPSIGVQSVPRSVFESGGPSSMSIDVTLDLPNDQGGQVHAVEHYELTIQRV
jgi:hypothetical protein